MKVLNFTASALFVVLVFYLLIVGEALLLPLVIAIAFWYLINTLAAAFAAIRLGEYNLPFPLCLVASVFTFLFLVWALINFLSGRVQAVLEVAPVYQVNLINRIEALPFVDLAQFQEMNLMQLLTDWIDIPSYATSVAASFAGILASGGLILIYIGFLFLEQNHFKSKITALASKGKEDDVNEILDRIRRDIQKYIGIKMFTSALTGILSYIVMRLLGVDFAGVWGLLIFLLNFIPTVGSIIATIFPAMIALAQSEGYTLFLVVLLGIGAIQICVGNILEPRLMGSRFNMSPIIILLNLALWGYIWGVPGMFLCVPFLIIITIILSYFPQTRPIAIILSRDGKLVVPKQEAFGNFSLNPDSKLLEAGQKEGSESP
ncbi:MAG: AI-2E family transporter [Pseudomonadales bacterium]|nr:AI-2E family transporter [Pseudomonadales bacterium]